jgi:hypothetical protein
MLTFAYAHLPHVLCALLLIARIGDVATTFLATPNLVLEGNPIVRKLGWPYALLTIGLCFLPYLNTAAALASLIAFLLVSASNAGKIWVIRTIGDTAYAAFLTELARKSKLSHALLGVTASSFFIALAGGTILLFYPSPAKDWGFWIAFGILSYAAIVWIYGTLWMTRLFRRAALPMSSTDQPIAAPQGGQ